MKKYSDKTHALLMAVVWTLSAVLFIVRVIWNLELLWNKDPLLLVAAILSTFNAIMWWSNYAKKRQEEQNHE